MRAFAQPDTGPIVDVEGGRGLFPFQQESRSPGL